MYDMKCASDYRSIARNSLTGKWSLAVLTSFIASLLGAELVGGGIRFSSDSTAAIIQDFQNTDFWLRIRTLVIIAVILLVIRLIVTIAVSGAVSLGYAKFNLNLIDTQGTNFSDLFSQFHRLRDGFCMHFLVSLYSFLWTLLLIIPGIVKGYSYAMTPYILLENPSMTATTAIKESQRIMNGNKWRLFCLDLSFIGWELLCAIPSLIAISVTARIALRTESLAVFLWLILLDIPLSAGLLVLRPYRRATYAAFY